MSATVVYLPPTGITLPRELRRLVNRLAHRQPQQHAVIERRAARLLVEYGLETALATLAPPAPR
jgi:hypothetical protein